MEAEQVAVADDVKWQWELRVLPVNTDSGEGAAGTAGSSEKRGRSHPYKAPDMELWKERLHSSGQPPGAAEPCARAAPCSHRAVLQNQGPGTKGGWGGSSAEGGLELAPVCHQTSPNSNPSSIPPRQNEPVSGGLANGTHQAVKVFLLPLPER